jgi:adenylate cyclase
MGIDFEAEGLLDGVDDDEAREARLGLLRELEADGFGLGELKEAAAEDRLPLLPVERVLTAEGRRYTAAELAERAALPEDFLLQNWRAIGFPRVEPEARVFTEDDLEVARTVKRFRDAGLPDDGILEIARVMGHGMSQVAATIGRVFGEAYLRAGDTERELGLRYAKATRRLAPETGPVLQHVLNVHQRELVRQAVVGSAQLASGRLPGAQHATVCFADLVGFTKLGERVPADELGAVGGRLTELASDVASPPVRLVKMIGDAAMLVSTEPGALLDAALALVERADAESEDFPQLRAGVAAGEALARAGDWYGRPVNLASRITSIARPGSVLAAAEVRDAAEAGYRWSFAGRRRVKGVRGEIALFRVRHADPDA